ncbi:MAG: T9SS type A sorting domain-containing protein [Bacteroidetes bacterium]|nr:T9SS type A sorting domain-containing protein [Bacteroidota bacterium]
MSNKYMRFIYHFILAFIIFISNSPDGSAQSQWKQIRNELCIQGEVSGSFLFYHTISRTNGFVRLDLRDTVFKTEMEMIKEKGDTFNSYTIGSRNQFAVIGKNLIKPVDSFVYVSHDFGDNWTKSNIQINSQITDCFGLNGVFGIAAGPNFIYSTDSGYTFLESKPFTDSAFEFNPLYLLDSTLFYQYLIDGKKLAFCSIRLDGSDQRNILIDSSSNSYRSNFVVLGNALIINLNHKIYLSKNGGDTWQIINEEEYFGLRTYNNYVFAIRRNGNNDLYYLTSDTFKTMQGVGTNSLLNNSATNTGFYNNDFYTIGWGGIFRLKNPDIALRHVTGTVYFDKNKNGILDNDESGIKNQTVRFQLSKLSTLTDSLGHYELDFFYGADKVYALPKSSAINVSPNYHISSAGIDTVNFGYQCDTSKANARIDITGRSSFNTYRGSDYSIICTNENGIDLKTTVRFSFPETIKLKHANPSPSATTDSTLEWDIVLKPLEQQKISTGFGLEISLNDGDTISTFAEFVGLKDWDSTDNKSALLQKVSSSYDPNDKSVSPVIIHVDEIDKSNNLLFTIRFQNTGNDTAFDVRIEDTLSDFIDPESVLILDASHRLITETDGKNLSFHFDNIYLPDSTTNEPESKGFVTFICQTKEQLKTGDKIENTAFIYFDQNEAIVTNTTSTSVVEISDAIHKIRKTFPAIYPNPTTGIVNLPAGVISVEVYDLTGGLIYSQNGLHESVDLEMVSNGLYWLKIIMEDSAFTSRLIIHH